MLDINLTSFDTFWAHLPRVNSTQTITAPTLSILFAFYLYQVYGRRLGTPKLKGPPSTDLIFGVNKDLDDAPDVDAVFQDWETTYGPVYQIPITFGSKMVILCDPKAIAHFYSKATTIYHQPDLMRTTMSRSVSFLLLYCVHEVTSIPDRKVAHDHGRRDSQEVTPSFLLEIGHLEFGYRQRRALSYAFSISAIRDLSPVFFETAYKVRLVGHFVLLLISPTAVAQRCMGFISPIARYSERFPVG